MNTKGYLDAVRALAPTGSVYAAAQLLGLKEDTVRAWHLERNYPDAYACARIAELLDLPVEQVIADINAEKEKDPERRAYWEGLARKFAACVVIGTSITTGTSDARLATGGAANVNAERQIVTLYELCDSRLLRRVCENLRWILQRISGRGFRRFPVGQLELAHS